MVWFHERSSLHLDGSHFSRFMASLHYQDYKYLVLLPGSYKWKAEVEKPA